MPVALTYLLRQMISADVDASPAAFLPLPAGALPFAGRVLLSPFDSACPLFFFLAIVSVQSVCLRGPVSRSRAVTLLPSINFHHAPSLSLR